MFEYKLFATDWWRSPFPSQVRRSPGSTGSSRTVRRGCLRGVHHPIGRHPLRLWRRRRSKYRTTLCPMPSALMRITRMRVSRVTRLTPSRATSRNMNRYTMYLSPYKSFIHSSVPSFITSFLSFIHSFVHSCHLLLIFHSFTHLIIHSFYSLNIHSSLAH